MKSLADSVVLMQSNKYQDRFCAEYLQLRVRMEKLNKFLTEIRMAEEMHNESPKHDCPVELLEEQLYNMEQYKRSLEERAIIESIDVWNFL